MALHLICLNTWTAPLKCHKDNRIKAHFTIRDIITRDLTDAKKYVLNMGQKTRDR